MRLSFIISLLLLAFAATAQRTDSATTPAATNRALAQIPEIESVAVFGPPMIFGGFSFYANRKGRLVYQSITPDDEKKHGYIEERLVVREHAELFAQLIEHLRAVDFLSYREGREHGIPDELRIRIELTFSNGSKITASKWASDKVIGLDELMDRMRATIDAARNIQKPVRIPYDEKDFGAHARILKPAKRDAAGNSQ